MDAIQNLHGDLPVPAPTSWRSLTDSPVLRNELWEAMRSIPRGTWTVAVLAGRSSYQPIAMQDYVVDDFGGLAELSHEAGVANSAWYASTYAIDQAACEWMDQFTAPVAPGSALQTMHAAARASRLQPAALQAHMLPAQHPLHAATVTVDDDQDWRAGQPLYRIDVEHDHNNWPVLTARQAKALAAVLVTLALTACGGGGDDPDAPVPDVATPRITCNQPAVCA